MQYIVLDNERGILTERGMFQKMLTPGKYRVWNTQKTTIQVTPAKGPVAFATLGLEPQTLLQDPTFANSTVSVIVPEGYIALHRVNKKATEVLAAGEYYFWNIFEEHDFTLFDMTATEQIEGITREQIGLIPRGLYNTVTVTEGTIGILYKDGKLERPLESGTYFFWNNQHNITTKIVEMRSTQVLLSGQEILTADKIGLRINFTCTYQVTNAVELLRAKQDYEDELYNLVQMALREHVGRRKLDTLLEEKEQVGMQILEYLKNKEQEMHIAFLSAGIKDIILPGDIQNIMNTVLLAEKEAQANVITRREETASTRSLLNTARLMEENQTLYKLKELEYMERIAHKISEISLRNGNQNVLEQLGGLLLPHSKKQDEE